ncbi:MAG: glycosyltransferase family 4 protein [Candidatus Saccharibacteria bacterium]|nr:glycosyltransferase family 4 protein [Candidatus Saccharibacteria bacterium]
MGMNIGMFTDIYRPAINGVTRSIDTIKTSLEARGHTVYIFAPAVRNHPKEERVIRLPSIKRLSPKEAPLGLAYVPFLTDKVRELELDIIHTHLPFFIGGLGYRIANKLSIPKIHTYHTHLTEYAHYSPVPGIQWPVKFGLRRLTKRYCNNSDYVIAPSTAIKDLLLSYGVKKPIVVNPTGIVCEDFKRLTQTEKTQLFQQYAIPTNQQIILFGGRLAKEKNLLFLLDCFSVIAQNNTNVHLVFAGGGPMEDVLEKHIQRLDLISRVTITGLLDKSEIAKFFGSADVFAFPSYTETQGIVLAEAMAAGCPVVAIDALGSKDAVHEGIDGFLVANDQNAFTAKLLQILNDDILQKRFSKAAIVSAQQFSVKNTTDRLLAIYADAIKDRSQTTTAA